MIIYLHFLKICKLNDNISKNCIQIIENGLIIFQIAGE